MRKFWLFFFIFWPIVAVISCWISPAMNWWFPGDGTPVTKLGQQIDDLFFLLLYIVTVVFIGTIAALIYVIWRASLNKLRQGDVWFTHGNHNLEVVWTIVPAGILLFIAVYQYDVWAHYRVQSRYPAEAQEPIAEVTARQFEWRIRYAAPGKKLQKLPQPDDLYAVNDLHVLANRAVLIRLRSGDVQHSFFVPELRVKQDAVPGQVIPVWFNVEKPGDYDLTCAELCGWGHYKMRGRVLAQTQEDFDAFIEQLEREQNDDGVTEPPAFEEE